jgi:transcriptional regulator with XRE-family HTH domain
MTFYEKMRQLRKDRGMSQSSLASKLEHVRGVNATAISRLEQGTWMPDAGQMALIFDALELSEDDRSPVIELARQTAIRAKNAA